MKFRNFFISIFFLLVTVTSFSGSRLPTYSTYLNLSNAKSNSGDITQERVKIDGVFWIIIYEDGVKINQYVDQDQS